MFITTLNEHIKLLYNTKNNQINNVHVNKNKKPVK